MSTRGRATEVQLVSRTRSHVAQHQSTCLPITVNKHMPGTLAPRPRHKPLVQMSKLFPPAAFAPKRGHDYNSLKPGSEPANITLRRIATLLCPTNQRRRYNNTPPSTPTATHFSIGDEDDPIVDDPGSNVEKTAAKNEYKSEDKHDADTCVPRRLPFATATLPTTMKNQHIPAPLLSDTQTKSIEDGCELLNRVMQQGEPMQTLHGDFDESTPSTPTHSPPKSPASTSFRWSPSPSTPTHSPPKTPASTSFRWSPSPPTPSPPPSPPLSPAYSLPSPWPSFFDRSFPQTPSPPSSPSSSPPSSPSSSYAPTPRLVHRKERADDRDSQRTHVSQTPGHTPPCKGRSTPYPRYIHR